MGDCRVLQQIYCYEWKTYIRCRGDHEEVYDTHSAVPTRVEEDLNLLFKKYNVQDVKK